MFLSEWREFPSAPCLAGEKKTWWQLASRCCWNRARPWHASELVSVLVGLRSYQHPGRYEKNTVRRSAHLTVIAHNCLYITELYTELYLVSNLTLSPYQAKRLVNINTWHHIAFLYGWLQCATTGGHEPNLCRVHPYIIFHQIPSSSHGDCRYRCGIFGEQILLKHPKFNLSN